jgi:hypothetical protein
MIVRYFIAKVLVAFIAAPCCGMGTVMKFAEDIGHCFDRMTENKI